MMKLVRAVLRPERLGILLEALDTDGFYGLTITPIEGGRHKGTFMQELCSGLLLEDTLPRIQIEIVTTPGRVELLTNIIMESCRTGKAGDGRIDIIPVERAIRIRNGGSSTSHRVALNLPADDRACTFRLTNDEHNSTSVPHPVAADQKGAR